MGEKWSTLFNEVAVCNTMIESRGRFLISTCADMYFYTIGISVRESLTSPSLDRFQFATKRRHVDTVLPPTTGQKDTNPKGGDLHYSFLIKL